MTRYYIDGYNLLFRLSRHSGDLATKRQQLLTLLNTYAQKLRLDCILVFDTPSSAENTLPTHYQSLTIIYASGPETADERIVRELLIESSLKGVTVVTSDRTLGQRCRNMGAKVEGVELFMDAVSRRFLSVSKQGKRAPEKKVDRVVPVQKVNVVDEKTKVEDCLDYYLDNFTKALGESAPLPLPKATGDEEVEGEREEEGAREEIVSDTERWLRIFEARQGEED